MNFGLKYCLTFGRSLVSCVVSGASWQKGICSLQTPTLAPPKPKFEGFEGIDQYVAGHWSYTRNKVNRLGRQILNRLWKIFGQNVLKFGLPNISKILRLPAPFWGWKLRILKRDIDDLLLLGEVLRLHMRQNILRIGQTNQVFLSTKSSEKLLHIASPFMHLRSQFLHELGS